MHVLKNHVKIMVLVQVLDPPINATVHLVSMERIVRVSMFCKFTLIILLLVFCRATSASFGFVSRKFVNRAALRTCIVIVQYSHGYSNT